MPHWKSMMDRDFIFAFDLNGRDVNVKITRVTAGQLTGEGGRKSKKPVCFFEGKEKALALNATNCKMIATMYGNDTDKWIGRWITLYPTTTEMSGKTVDCIRVRPQPPRANGQRQQQQPIEDSDPEPPDNIDLPVEREPGVEG